MTHKKDQWGVVFFLFAILLLCISIYLNPRLPLQKGKPLYETLLPWTGLFLYSTILIIGQFSYSRIHNLRIFLLGYSSGILGIGYFLLARIIPFPYPPPLIFDKLIFLIGVCNLIVIMFAKPQVKYVTARAMVLTLLCAEITIFLVVRLAKDNFLNISDLIQFVSNEQLLLFSSGIILIGFLLSIWRIKTDFKLGGLIAASFFFLGASIFLDNKSFLPHDELLTIIILAFVTLIGVSVHWISQLDYRVSIDPLLKIYNRDYCLKILSEQANINTAPPFSIAMIDIDHFKKVNDQYGHQAGDNVLHTVAQKINSLISDQGISCRYGGEEIAVFLPNKTAKEASDLLEHVRQGIEKSSTLYGKKKIKVTISSGVAQRDDISQPLLDIVNVADKALYKAKEDGRNQVKVGKVSKR